MTEPLLEPIEPDTAVELYLTERESELAKQTLRTHRGRLKPFLEWCEDNDIDNLNDLTGRDTRRYKIWKSESIKNVTLKSYMDTLRVFLRWAVDIDAVHPDLPDKVQSPSLRKGENEKTTHIDSETAQDILSYLRKFEYATLSHVVWEILWHTGMRRGAARSLDISDYHSEDQYLDVCHRPETDTPLKNRYEGERPVSISEAVATVIEDWIESQRPDVTDDYGRAPFLATDFGRIHGQTIQKYIYMWSRPVQPDKTAHTGETLRIVTPRSIGTLLTCVRHPSPRTMCVGQQSLTHSVKMPLSQQLVTALTSLQIYWTSTMTK